MSLTRVLEPELMDTFEEASDYNSMDHREVNGRFVADLLAAAPELAGPVGTMAAGVVINAAQMRGFAAPSFPFPVDIDPLPLEVLDLGTGTALIPVELCKTAENCRVVAIDAAENMLELAVYNLELGGVRHRLLLDLVDAKKLPFNDGRFPVVMSNSIVHHIPEPRAVLAEAVRVTTPGGLLFFRDLLRPETSAEVDRLVATYAAGANEHQQLMFANSLRAALSLDEIRSLAADLGFPAASVTATSDRHWTWSARKPM